MTIGILPHNDGEVGGCLFTGSEDKPSDKGLLVYLNANGRLDDAIAAVMPNGGSVLKPKHPIGPYGSVPSFWIARGTGWRCIRIKNLDGVGYVVKIACAQIC